MKNFLIMMIQLGGFAFCFVAFLSLVNYLFDLGLGYKGSEVPGEPEFAAAFLILGMIFVPAGAILGRRSKPV